MEQRTMKWLLAAISKHQNTEVRADGENIVLCGLKLDSAAQDILGCRGHADALCIRIHAYQRDLVVCHVKIALTETAEHGQHVVDSCGIPPAQRTRAMVMCNQVNDTIVAGRFMVDPTDGELYLEMPIVLHGDVDEDERMFSDIMARIEFTVCRYVPLILKGAQGDTQQAMRDVINARNMPSQLSGFEFTTVRISAPLSGRPGADSRPVGKVVSMGEALGATDSEATDTDTSGSDDTPTQVRTVDLSQENADDGSSPGS